jgi:O-Antigen ligase
LIPAAAIVYISLKNGGYDEIPRDQTGVIVWWLVLVGAVVAVVAGSRPAIRWRSAPGILVILLAAFCVWTAIALSWTQSGERTMIEVARVATYLGFLVIGFALVRFGYGRELLYGAVAGIGVVVLLALLSRLEPTWFPKQTAPEFISGVQIERRLAYPLNYSTGLAAMAAMGLPLFLCLMASGRTIVGRSLGAAILPVAALVLWWTGSGLAIPLGAIGVLVYLFLTDDRLAAVASLALAAIGGLVLIVASHSRAALETGRPTPEAMSQGDQLLVIAIVVCLAIVGLNVALGFGLRRLPRTRGLIPPHRARQLVLAGVVALVAVVAIAGATGALSDRWQSFKSATGLNPNQGGEGAQLTDISARGRYQFWQGAVDAWRSEPVLGIGPGTFEFWWAQHGNPDAAIFVVNAHSLYLETLAELGPIGFMLILGFVVVALILGALRAWRATLGDRPDVAAAAAACFVFAAAAAVDWVWQLAALPIAFMFLTAAAVGAESERAPVHAEATAPERAPSAWRRFGPAGIAAAIAVVALVVILIPLSSSSAVARSQQQVADGSLADALDTARDAVAVEPFAATPRIQEATTLEVMGQVDDAVAVAREAVTKEPVNWRLWLVLSRLEAEAGNPRAAVADYRQAQSLFPRGISGS